MALYSAAKERSLDEIRTSLSTLVCDFESDAPGNRRLIRDLLDNDRDLFYSSALEIVKNAQDSRGVQYLVALLVANGMVLEALCDPALTKDEAIALGRAAIRVDPTADATLARGLADSETGQGSVVVHDPPRLMEILCEVGDPARMMASMLRMLRHPSEYIRSKAVKVVGRGSKSPKWVRQRLNEADPRIRANAIEAIWGVDTDEARILLQFAAADPNNRVAANSLLGLYYLGENAALTELVKMASHESPLFRQSAAWAMGETGDPRFTDSLRAMLSQSDAVLRKRAFAALGRLKNANSLTTAGTRWHVGARLLAGEGKTGTRRMVVAVATDDAKEQPNVPSLGMILSEGGQYITSYKVTERKTETLSVVFVMPRRREADGAFHEALESCLKWKRTSDLWSILPYMETGDGEPPPPSDPEPPTFSANIDTLRSTLADAPKRVDCMDLWSTMWRAAKLGPVATRGKRHVIVMSSAQEARLAGHGLIARVEETRLPLQTIASGPNRRLEEFCSAVNSPFQVCPPDEIGDAIRLAYLTLLARYEISYQPVSLDAPSLKLRVQAPGGWGETIVPYSKKT